MEKKLIDYIDFERINLLLDRFNNVTGFVTAILDLEGNILSKSGWRTICTDFHRVHPETSVRCTESDTCLAGQLESGQKYNCYKCLNGLIDVAVPIIINDEHVANLFSGQFFFEKPSRDFFIVQAQKYNFDKTNYLEALDKVPVVSEEKVKTAMNFLLDMTLLISEMTQQRIDQIELNKTLKESEERWQFAIEENGDGLFDWSIETNEVFYSKQWKAMLGFDEFEIENKFEEWENRVHPDDKAAAHEAIKSHFDGTTDIYSNEHRILCKDGSYKWILAKGKIISRTKKNKPSRLIGTHRDITEQKKSEYLIQESEEKYKALFDNAPLSYQSLDEEGRFIDINPSWLRTLGYERNEVIGKLYADFLHPDWKPHFEKNFPEFKKRGYVNDVQFKLQHKKGHFIDISFEGCIGYLPDGSFKQTYCVFQDITEKKKSEKLLLESEEKYKQLYESNQMPISIFDTETLDFLSVNNAFVEKYGYTEEEFLKMTILDIRPDTETPKLKQSVSTMDNGLTNAGIFLHKKKNGEIIHVEIIRYDLVFEGKNAKLVFANDITERIQAEENLKENEEKFRTFVNTASDLMCITNKDGQLTDVNRAMSDVLDYSIEELKEMHISNLLTEEALKNDFNPNWGKFINDGKITIETNFRTKGGDEIPGELKAIAIYNGSNKLVGTRAVFVDLTKHKHAEEELKKHKENLEELVDERTKELEEKYAELERINKLFVGRELRMVELKEKIKELTGYIEDITSTQ